MGSMTGGGGARLWQGQSWSERSGTGSEDLMRMTENWRKIWLASLVEVLILMRGFQGLLDRGGTKVSANIIDLRLGIISIKESYSIHHPSGKHILLLETVSGLWRRPQRRTWCRSIEEVRYSACKVRD